MAGAPPGSLVKIYMDTNREIEPGDEIQTRSGRRYEVEGVRIQTRGNHVGRKHLEVRVLAEDHPRDPDAVVHVLWWYARPKARR